MSLDERVAKMESKVDRHENSLDELKDSQKELRLAMKELAQGLQKLVIAEARREEDRDTIKRIFKEIGEVKNEVTSIKKEYSDKELSYAKSALAEQKEKSKVFWQDTVRTILLVVASLLVYHFGAHLIG